MNDIDPIHVLAASVGFSSAALLWLALIAGLLVARGWTMTRLKHTTMLTIHGVLAVLGLTLGTVHGFAQLTPPTGTVELIDVVVPFTNEVDPWGIGAGVIALEVMIAAAVSLSFQKWIGFHRWRALHATVYAAYTAMTVHVLVSGSETGYTWVQVVVVVPWAAAMVLWLKGPGDGARRFGARLARARTTSVQVDPVRCVRFGFCEQEAPETFTLRGDGQLAYHSAVGDEHLDAVVRAARACPARAIAVAQGGRVGDPRVIPLRMTADRVGGPAAHPRSDPGHRRH
jgi:sulfoxide reductase heme-binding subunit YedZ